MKLHFAYFCFHTSFDMKKFVYSGIIVTLLASCSTSTEQVSMMDDASKGTKHAEKELLAVESNRKLILEIDGMVREMGCGGSIRKELKATGAVSRCTFDFADENATSTASIEFDKDNISADEIAELIKQLNDGQFTIGKMSTQPLAVEVKNSTDPGQAESFSEKPAPINVSSSSGIQLPNFIDLLSSLLIH